MNNIKPDAVLESVVNLIKNTISDAKIEYASSSTATLKDGNDTIYLEQKSDNSGNSATIFIKDKQEIIFSEDLLDPLKDLDQTATIIVNDLDVETYLIFQAVKDEFDQLSNSYEFVKATEKEVQKAKSTFKFGKHVFDLIVSNERDQIIVAPEFSSSFDSTIKKTIEADALKVQHAMCAEFK
ncbi:hypothetical protein [Pedobacter caeni]|uniref:Uncharacterized protein n=1 Tax=Pedobacter caeni TaxID=288992 RepID=A0A1M5A340_9SPHI|nr:hypothetical protein [Pedobacter caeni]SHF24272.1 hypothetical protein SAMN04488522_102552 [Pedobacter caeni]